MLAYAHSCFKFVVAVVGSAAKLSLVRGDLSTKKKTDDGRRMLGNNTVAASWRIKFKLRSCRQMICKMIEVSFIYLHDPPTSYIRNMHIPFVYTHDPPSGQP